MDVAVISTVVAAVLTGGLATEILRTFRDRKKADFELFYPTWKEEMDRLHKEIGELRLIVLALSEAVDLMGGDSMSVRTRALSKGFVVDPEDEDEQEFD